MSLNVSGLVDFVQENTDVITKAIVANDFLSTPGLMVLDNVHGTTVKLPLLNSTIYGRANDCTASDSGTTVMTQVSIGLENILWQTNDCAKTLNDKFTWQYTTDSSQPELQANFQDVYIKEKVEKVQRDYVDLLFGTTTGTGTTQGGTNYAINANSILRNAKVNEATTVTGATSAVTEATAIAYVKNLTAKIPAAVADMDDLTLFVNAQTFYAIQSALVALNYFHAPLDKEGDDGAIMWPYQNLKIRKTSGLQGKLNAVLTPTSNICVAQLVGGEYEAPVMYQDPRSGALWTSIAATFGASIIYPELSVVLL